MLEPLVINDLVTIPGEDLSWCAARSSGAGGQNVNKVASKVELRFDLPNCSSLAQAVKERLAPLVRNKLDADGRVLIVSQRSRDQRFNLDDALAKLKELILQALVPPKPRRPTKPTRGSKERRLSSKKIHSQHKQNRRSSED